jgi:uncharacterized protein (TIGR00106 family)
MLVQFSVWPADSPHMHEDVVQVRDVLKQQGLAFEVGPMGTTIEGTWPEIMEAIRLCHEAVSQAHERVLTTITIDDHKNRQQSIREAVEKVATASR